MEKKKILPRDKNQFQILELHRKKVSPFHFHLCLWSYKMVTWIQSAENQRNSAFNQFYTFFLN